MFYMNPPLNSFKSDTLTEQIADCLFACFFVCYFIFLFLLFSCDFVAFLVKNISDTCKEAFDSRYSIPSHRQFRFFG